jgi:hypothetical protein
LTAPCAAEWSRVPTGDPLYHTNLSLLETLEVIEEL